MRKIIPLLAIALAGCASTSTGVLPMGPDTFIVSREGGTGMASTGKLKAEAIREATAFCAESKKQFMIVHTQETHPAPLAGGFPQAEVQFMCLSAGDPQLIRPQMRNDPNQVVEIRKDQN